MEHIIATMAATWLGNGLNAQGERLIEALATTMNSFFSDLKIYPGMVVPLMGTPNAPVAPTQPAVPLQLAPPPQGAPNASIVPVQLTAHPQPAPPPQGAPRAPVVNLYISKTALY